MCVHRRGAERHPAPPGTCGADRGYPVSASISECGICCGRRADGTVVARVAARAAGPAQARLRALQRQAQPGDRPRPAQRAGPAQSGGAGPARIGRVHPRGADMRRDTVRGDRRAGPAPPGDRGRGPQRHGDARANPRRQGGRRLNRALADVAPAELRGQLGYKTRWYGSCSVGGPVVPKLEDLFGLRRGESQARPGRRNWTCDGSCGAVHDRDLNAAINLARLSGRTPAWKAGPPGWPGGRTQSHP